MSTETTYTVSGMTCQHCAASVREEVGELPGVERVDVELEGGRVTVVGAAPRESVAAAVAVAGYVLEA